MFSFVHQSTSIRDPQLACHIFHKGRFDNLWLHLTKRAFFGNRFPVCSFFIFELSTSLLEAHTRSLLRSKFSQHLCGADAHFWDSLALFFVQCTSLDIFCPLASALLVDLTSLAVCHFQAGHLSILEECFAGNVKAAWLYYLCLFCRNFHLYRFITRPHLGPNFQDAPEIQTFFALTKLPHKASLSIQEASPWPHLSHL